MSLKCSKHTRRLSTIFNHTTLNLFLICFIFLLISCNKYERSEESANYLKEPEIGDIYFVEKEGHYYTLLKLKSFDTDSVTFYKNRSDYHRKYMVDASENNIKYKKVYEDLNNPDSWTDSIISYSRDKVNNLYNDEVIYEIKRN